MQKGAIFLVVLALSICLAACQAGETVDPAENDGLVRRDVEDLVEVHIEDGKATAYFMVERWDELYGMDDIHEGAFKISGPAGRVKDAAIARIPELHFANGMEVTVPSIFLLLEDGSVAWSHADMYLSEGGNPELQSYPLMGLKGIVSFSYESDG